jgi:hypothetical protein
MESATHSWASLGVLATRAGVWKAKPLTPCSQAQEPPISCHTWGFWTGCTPAVLAQATATTPRFSQKHIPAHT